MPNRLFNVYNSHGRRGWIVAESEERAIDLAFTHGWARKLANLKATEDTFPYVYQGLDEILDGPEGIAAVELSLLGTDTSPLPKNGKWVVYPFPTKRSRTATSWEGR